ncbi:hypothetical protein ES703_73182 [subsurface metagenome]
MEVFFPGKNCQFNSARTGSGNSLGAQGEEEQAQS